MDEHALEHPASGHSECLRGIFLEGAVRKKNVLAGC